MKYLNLLVLAIAMTLFLSSCGANFATIGNLNMNSTQVQLASNNFKVVDRITGSSSVSYVLIFGGMTKEQLFENAYSAMMAKAKLSDGARAVANVVTEEHIGGVPPFYYTRTVTVSANIIEFTR